MCGRTTVWCVPMWDYLKTISCWFKIMELVTTAFWHLQNTNQAEKIMLEGLVVLQLQASRVFKGLEFQSVDWFRSSVEEELLIWPSCWQSKAPLFQGNCCRRLSNRSKRTGEHNRMRLWHQWWLEKIVLAANAVLCLWRRNRGFQWQVICSKLSTATSFWVVQLNSKGRSPTVRNSLCTYTAEVLAIMQKKKPTDIDILRLHLLSLNISMRPVNYWNKLSSKLPTQICKQQTRIADSSLHTHITKKLSAKPTYSNANIVFALFSSNFNQI